MVCIYFFTVKCSKASKENIVALLSWLSTCNEQNRGMVVTFSAVYIYIYIYVSKGSKRHVLSEVHKHCLGCMALVYPPHPNQLALIDYTIPTSVIYLLIWLPHYIDLTTEEGVGTYKICALQDIAHQWKHSVIANSVVLALHTYLQQLFALSN